MVCPGACNASTRSAPRGRTDASPARGNLELARGRNAEALADYRAAERLGRQLASSHTVTTRIRGQLLHALVRLGETEMAEQTIAAMDAQQQQSGPVRTALAALRLVQHDPEAATIALAPILDDGAEAIPAKVHPTFVVVQACLLEALARDALGDAGARERALERALDLAEPDGLLLPFLFHPTPDLLERHSRFRTTHGSLISEILQYASRQQRASRSPSRRAWPNRSAGANSVSCATCLPTSRTRKSRANSTCRSTPSRPTSSISTPSSTPTTAATRSSEAAHSVCSPLPAQTMSLRRPPAPFDGAREHLLDVPDGWIYAVELGEGPLVVLIHGFPRRASAFAGTSRPLAEARASRNLCRRLVVKVNFRSLIV